MTTILGLVIFGLALPAVLSCAYLLVLTLMSASSKPPVPPARKLYFDVIVPAHNEEAVISRTVASLRRLDWPADLFRVIVVADNCIDATASIAKTAGAEVLVRNDSLRGKGHALAFAFEFSAAQARARAVVVVDADAEVSTNLLEAFAARIDSGEVAIQAHYGVQNPRASWRTQLMTIATTAFHIVRSRARARLGLSCGIRGNGWCVTHELLRELPYHYFSLTEDLEYGIELGLAGHRVAYADEAWSNAEMVTRAETAGPQRQRWEQGRFDLVRTKTLPLLRTGIKRRSLLCLDLAADLLVLPLAYVALNVALLIAVAGVTAFWLPAMAPWLWCGLTCSAALLLHVMRGWQLSGLGAGGLAALAHVPGYLVWKVRLLARKKAKEWVKTERESP